MTAIYLVPPLPAGSSHLLGTAGPASCPTHGVAPDRVYSGPMSPWAGCALTAPFHPYRRERQSSFAPLFLLSPPELRFRRGPRLGRQSKLHIVRFAAEAAKRTHFAAFPLPDWGDAAVSFCCTGPGVTPGGRYPLSLPCGARTFLTGGLSASPRGCPTRSPGYCNPFKRDCQMSCKIFFGRLYYR